MLWDLNYLWTWNKKFCSYRNYVIEFFVHLISVQILFMVDFVHSIITTTKLSPMVLASKNLQEIFVMLAVVVFYFTGGFSFHCFSHFYRECYGRWGQGHPFRDPPLSLPSRSCLFWLTRGLGLLMFELQDH